MNPLTRLAVVALFLLLPMAAFGAAPAPAPPAVAPDHAARMAQGLELFKTRVRPLLTQQCVACHGGEKTKGDFDLTTREALLRGGSSGLVLIPGSGRQGRLYRLITHADKPHMPQKAPRLPDQAIADLAAWIDAGAPYDRPLVEAAPSAPMERTIGARDRQFWSFQPLAQPAPPPVHNEAWCRSPIDRFVLARLEAKGLHANAPAQRRQLIRRASFDLIGLPPTPEEVEAFVKDPDPDAYPKLIDRLLASPHYGERWGRHWLDLARFAESHGYEQDYDRPTAYHYRDFVIQALNQDMSYDRFVQWQIAGDELEPNNPLAVMATGYLAAGVHATQITASQVEKERYDELDDMTATIGTSLLGLTIGCARCHDHKFDPIPQKDYYRLLATFTTTVRSEIDLDLHPERTRPARAEYNREQALRVEALARFEKQQLPARLDAWLAGGAHLPAGVSPAEIGLILKTPAAQRSEVQKTALRNWYRTLDPEWQQLNRRVLEHTAKAPKSELTRVMVASEGLKPIRLHTQGADFFDRTYFLKRGDLNQKQGEAAPGFLQVLTRAPEQEKHWQVAPPPGWRTSYRRRALAAWITDTDQGAGALLARVIVNRLWQHHLGRGIVATASDFGAQGERPTHPELLDWLAGELIRNGWRLKPLHRLIMTSAVYQQDAAFDPAGAAADPDNTLCWRRSRRRLEGEAIRDAMLAISGTLDRTPFGPGTLDEGMRRRSIYFTVKRSHLVPLMVLFDAPDTLQSSGSRSSTTTAPQAMALMNNPQVRACARAFALRLLPQAGAAPAEVIRTGYLAALGRPPADDELADSQAFVQRQVDSYRSAGKANAMELALADFCQALFSLNEFVYVE